MSKTKSRSHSKFRIDPAMSRKKFKDRSRLVQRIIKEKLERAERLDRDI